MGFFKWDIFNIPSLDLRSRNPSDVPIVILSESFSSIITLVGNQISQSMADDVLSAV